MTRQKVKLTFIANDSERKNSFRKRKKGLLKKVNEISTLCGVDACAIIFSPNDTDPEVWPSPPGAQRVLARLRGMPESEQNKKMVNQESFTRQRIKKAEEQLRRLRRENRRKEIDHMISQCFIGGMSCPSFSLVDLNDVGLVLTQNLVEINMRIESIRKEHLANGRTTSAMHRIGETSNHGRINLNYQRPGNAAREIPKDEVQIFRRSMQQPRSDERSALGAEDTHLPYTYIDDASGPSFTCRQLGN